ncbi:MAG: DNA polymerase I [bacterium]|nr:DNA polymerase I [bacterium]
MTDKEKHLYLFDGSALFYRAYFAFIRNPLINSKGEHTSATYGFVNSVLRVIREESPDYMAVVFDTKEPTFRHQMYDQYKANREAMPEDLASQLPRIRQAVEALNLAHYELAGYEADDVIGTIAAKSAGEKLKVHIVTSDKDCFQLVTDHVNIYRPRSAGEGIDKMGAREVEAKFGVRPELVIDKLALMGDSSDNVPGVPGVGPKTADKLLSQFGNLDSILERHSEIAAKGVRSKIENNIEQARLSRELVTIDCDVPIPFKLEEMKSREIDREATITLFQELELKRLLKQLITDDKSPGGAAETVKSDADAALSARGFYHLVSSIADLKKLIKQFASSRELAVDTETTSLDAHSAKLVGISITDRPSTGYYIPVGHNEESGNLPLDDVLALVKPLLENPKIQKFGQNIKYDYEILIRYGIDITPISFDTMLASYVIDPSGRQHSLDAMAKNHFNYEMQPITDLIGKGKSQKSFDTVPIDKATDYAAEDADLTFRLRGKLAPMIERDGLHKLYYNIELPLVKVLATMERNGVKIDADYLAGLSEDMESRLETNRASIYEIAGGEFNINSTQQLSHILFEKLNLPTRGMTAKKTGYSTDVKVLENLAPLHPLPAHILEYRQLTKLKNTYIDALPKMISPETGRVHTSYNQTVAATGRLSSTDPNLQNIPIRTDEGRQIRRAFIPTDSDHILLSADYSQIELRILAHYAEDEVLIKAYREGEDIHARTAAEVYDIPIDEVDDSMRRAAKTANFAIIYGVSAFGLTQQTELNMSEAQQFISKYFERYPGIRNQMESSRQFARDNGYVTTMFDRRRYIPDIGSSNHNVRQFAERIAINTPIQGTAADMIKLAMIKIHDNMAGMKSRMILQVHDELVFDVYRPELKKIRKIVKDGMEKVVKLKVPLVADMGEGDNWLDAK